MVSAVRKQLKIIKRSERSELSTSISEDMVRRCSSCVASDSFILSSSAQDREPNYGRIRAYSVDRNMKNSYTIFMIIAKQLKIIKRSICGNRSEKVSSH